MAKKIRWEYIYDENINIIGISCHKMDYWITLQINEKLKLKLTRQPDLSVYAPEKLSSINYPQFRFINPDTQPAYSLISNHSPDGKLFPDQRSFDYFLLISGRLSDAEKLDLVEAIKKIPHVLIAHIMNLKKIKNFQEFFTDLELHMIEIRGKKETNFKQLL